MDRNRRNLLLTLGSVAAGATTLAAQPPSTNTHEPIFRVSRANSVPREAVNPLDRALEMAREGLVNIRENVTDYTTVIVKRERLNGTLTDPDFMFAKIRNRKVKSGQLHTPFGVYLMFLKPTSVKGREVVYVEGQNDGRLIAHEGGMRGRFLPTVPLDPNGALAMRGQRYPLTEIGIENLIVKLIERGETARQHPEITCEFRKNAKLKDRVCTVIQLNQPRRVSELEFSRAQIFIDDELNLPIRYVAYDWPTEPGGTGAIIEEYNYLDVKINPGLSDSEFDRENPAYNF
ncbi:hypothetical protein FF011L_07380 [Roseimaritima multifibrata]|uniref:DUF1571 domain-containing protein n=1 Tax=Roseimaritima multifibrata TaxID=1930274 RepID=A0A517MAT5_9BACT|nr:DUF1571 domain-containing protein [Roseimaritima multifibrata]QDS92002.1 hypothetical protein FF011L_07380 [Roseimaritima multifibrata]